MSEFNPLAKVKQQFFILNVDELIVSFIFSDEEEKPDTNKGVRQSAKLHFREEDFLKKSMKRDVSSHSLSSSMIEERYVEGHSSDPLDTSTNGPIGKE